MRSRSLQPGVDRLALQREDAEHALVHAVERLPAHETLQGLDAERELPDRERALPSQRPGAETGEIRRRRVLRPVDQPEVLAAADLQTGLRDTLAAADDPLRRLHDHPFAT